MGKARDMSRDQYTASDPTKLYADVDTKRQTHPSPGLDAKLDERRTSGRPPTAGPAGWRGARR